MCNPTHSVVLCIASGSYSDTDIITYARDACLLELMHESQQQYHRAPYFYGIVLGMHTQMFSISLFIFKIKLFSRVSIVFAFVTHAFYTKMLIFMGLCCIQHAMMYQH